MPADNFLRDLEVRLNELAKHEMYNSELARMTFICHENEGKSEAKKVRRATGLFNNSRESDSVVWQELAGAIKSLIAKINSEEKGLSTESTFEVGYHSNLIQKTDAFAQKAALRTELQELLDDIFKRFPDIKEKVEAAAATPRSSRQA